MQLVAMTFFFGADNPLSNWHPATFEVRGIRFCNNEQFMMYCKARLFNDQETAAQILIARSPRDHKALGRKVSGFVDDVWTANCQRYVRVGCMAKFSQNLALRDFLLSTGESELVEASPYDRIWGVGLAATDIRIHDKAQWRGQNLLGIILMQVRTELRNNLF